MDDDEPRRGRGGSSRTSSRRKRLFRSLRRRVQNGDEDDEDDMEVDLDEREEEGYFSSSNNKARKGKRRTSSASAPGGVRRRMNLMAMARGGNSSHRHSKSSLKQSFSRRLSLHSRPANAGGNKKRTSLIRQQEEEDERDDDVVTPLPEKSSKTSPNRTGTSKRRSFGKIKNALLTRSSTRRRHSTRSNGENSVDSPPSVASTENSLDNQARGLSSPALTPLSRRPTTTFLHFPSSSLPMTFSPKLNMAFPIRRQRDDDDENGARMEAASPDYYYQSVQWVLKTWIYFLTVVIPFGIMYWSFIGLFHSTALQQIPIWKRVPFHNMLLLGMGCTLKSTFLARQALDSRGVLAKAQNDRNDNRPTVRRSTLYSNSNNKRSIPKRDRNRSRSKSVLPRKDTTSNRSGGSFSMLSQNATSSFWEDFDRVMPTRNQSTPKRGLKRGDKLKSTLEIYQFHANDEKIGILMGGAGDGDEDD
mgnify:CR=1 FL=1